MATGRLSTVAAACLSRASDGGLSQAETGTHRQWGSLGAGKSASHEDFFLQGDSEGDRGFLLLLKHDGGGQRELLCSQRGQVYPWREVFLRGKLLLYFCIYSANSSHLIKVLQQR